MGSGLALVDWLWGPLLTGLNRKHWNTNLFLKLSCFLDSNTENTLMVARKEGEGAIGKTGKWNREVQTSSYKRNQSRG